MSRRLAAILLFGLALRAGLPLAALAVAGSRADFSEPDSAAYVMLAESLLENGRFARAGIPETDRTPGYPLFLTAGVALGAVTPVTIALQVALGVTTIWLVYLLGRELRAPEVVALSASALYACEPLSIAYASRLMSETLFTTLVVASLLALVRFAGAGSWRALAAAAVAAAAAAYVRPVFVFVPLVVLPLLLVRRGAPQQTLSTAGVWLAVTGVLLGAWMARNIRQADYAGFSSISSKALYFYQAAAVSAALDGRTLSEEQARLGYPHLERYFELHPEQRSWTPGDVFRHRSRQGLAVLREHPALYAAIHVRGMAAVLLGNGAEVFLRSFGADLPSVLAAAREGRSQLERLLGEHSGAVLFEFAVAALLYVSLALAAIGVYTLRAPHPGWWSVGIVCAYLLAVSGGPHGTSRFRHALMPPICVAAAFGASRLCDGRRERRAARDRGAAGCARQA